MAVYGIGATFKRKDYSKDFMENGIAFISWSDSVASELHKFFQNIKIGDIFYIKSYNPSKGLTVKAAGIVSDNDVVKVFDAESRKIITDATDIDKVKEENKRMCLSVKWIWQGDNKTFIHYDPNMDKYNVRNVAIYEEFNEEVLEDVIDKIAMNIYKDPKKK
ncbi:hypothetical protein [Dysgonomonas termitidis]|uniref:Uncharacterized protein n=1 Tax=Dysgonomonas termitidis TaxID=1516126 RepID=A0ABV9L0R0_9BACT